MRLNIIKKYSKSTFPFYTLIATAIAAVVSISISLFSGYSIGSGSNLTKIHPADTAAYSLGHEHGIELVNLNLPPDGFATRLLDIRARQHIIATRFGPTAAKAYQSGFEDAIEAVSPDSLAPMILNH